MLRRIAMLALLLPAISTFAAWGPFQTYAILDFGQGNSFRAGGLNPDGAGTFDTFHYGFFRPGDTFILNGGEVKTYKNGSSNVCGGILHYRVYKECETPGGFSTIALPFESNLGGGDQRWQQTAANVDLLTGLSKGDYVLEVFWEVDGNETDPGGCGESLFDSNFGTNFSATFTVGEESFADGDFTAGPVWSGDTGSFSVLDASTLTGDGSNGNVNNFFGENDQTLVSNASTGDATLTLPSAQAYGVWEFSVATGLNWDPSAANNFAIILTSDTDVPANLQIGSMDFNGYYIKWDNNGATDSFSLFKREGTTETEILDTNYPGTANAVDGYTLKVVRTTSGEFTIYADQGFDNTDASTVRGTIRDNDITTSSFFAVSTNITNPGDQRRLYFDNLMFGNGTEVSFGTPSASFTETDADESYSFVVNIDDEDDRCATTYEVYLISGDAARIDNFATQTLTFAAGDNTPQNVLITVTGNDTCERDEVLVFGIQNVSGGCEAQVGPQDTFTLTLDDDESGTDVESSEDFESGVLSGWTNTGQWDVLSSAGTISGDFDLRHTQTVAASDYISRDLDGLELRGAETSWRFNLKKGGFESSSNNWLKVVLAGSEEDAFSGSLDGYAVGINFGTATDELRLVRIDNGVYTDIVTSTFDWNTNTTLGIEVVRDEFGTWELRYQDGGGFDAMTSAGTVLDLTYLTADFFSYAVTVSIGNINKCRIDDISIAQYGCFDTYYSVGDGNTNGVIWSLNDPVGAGGLANFGRYKSLVVQNGTTVTLSGKTVSRNMTIEAGGTFNGPVGDVVVFGDWTNDGTFDPQTGTVLMKGNGNQSIGGASANTFNNLRIDNDGAMVTMNGNVDMIGVLYPDQGTLDVNGNVLTLVSNASGTASIGAFNASSDLLGDITMQRYIPAGNQNWVNLGAPLTGLDINAWNDDIITTGFTGSDFPDYQYGDGTLFNNIQKYDESVNGGLNDGWEESGDVSDALETARGYMVYMLGTEQNIDMTGGIQKGDMSQPIDYNAFVGTTIDGWNLVVNRYPSEIDWDALAAASPGVSTYYVFDADAGSYISYNGLTQVGSAPRYIAPGQSFWAKADAAGASLEWTEGIKSSSGQAFERSYEPSAYVSFTVNGAGYADEAFVAFQPEATVSYENEFDAHKLGSMDEDAVSIAAIDADGLPMAINTISFDTDNVVTIPLRISAVVAGTYTLESGTISGLPSSACLSIEDTQEGTFSALTGEESWELSLEENEVSERFVLHINAPVAMELSPISCFGANDAAITVTAPGAGTWTANWYDEMDNFMGTSSFNGTMEVEGLAMGNYLFQFENSDLQCATLEEVITVDEAQQHLLTSEYDFNLCNIGNEGWIELKVENAEAFDLTLTKDGVVVYEGTIDSDMIIVDGLENGDYDFTINSGCLIENGTIEVKDPSATSIDTPENLSAELVDGEAEVTITPEVENADEFTWFLNGEIASTEEVFNTTFTEAGSFLVGVVASNEVCADSDETLITVEEVVSTSDIEFIQQLYVDAEAIVVQTEALPSVLEARVFNSTGQLVHSWSGSVDNTVRIALPKLASGVYIVELQSADQMVGSLKFTR